MSNRQFTLLSLRLRRARGFPRTIGIEVAMLFPLLDSCDFNMVTLVLSSDAAANQLPNQESLWSSSEISEHSETTDSATLPSSTADFAARSSLETCILLLCRTMPLLLVALSMTLVIEVGADEFDRYVTSSGEFETPAEADAVIDANLWRYTADGWHTVDEIRTVITPRRPWAISDCHPLIVACLQVFAAGFLLTLFSSERDWNAAGKTGKS